MDSWIFENSEILWGLAGIPVLLVIFLARSFYKKKQLKKLGSPKLRGLLMEQYSSTRPLLKNGVVLLALVFLLVALANPQVGSKLEKVKVKGAEIVIALDVSNSMKAEDLAPNRLEKAQQEIMQLLNRVKGDRVGLVVFAGKAFVPVPLTNDYAMIKMYLRGIDTDIISTQGTDIGTAITLAQESFTEDGSKNKAIIVITDGENHEENAIKVAKEAAEKGITIHTIGMGKSDGVPVPVTNRYGQKEFRKDKDGNVVVSKLNKNLLNEIAAAGKGQFVKASNSGLGLDKIYEQLKGMEKKDFEEKVVLDYEDDFQFYLWIALALLVLELVILPRKNKFLSRIKIANAKI